MNLRLCLVRSHCIGHLSNPVYKHVIHHRVLKAAGQMVGSCQQPSVEVLFSRRRKAEGGRRKKEENDALSGAGPPNGGPTEAVSTWRVALSLSLLLESLIPFELVASMVDE